MRAAESDLENTVSDDDGGRTQRAKRWALLSLTFAFNAFATYYYLANAEITHPAVLTTGLVVLWAVWVALLVDTLIARGAKRMHRAVANVAPACVVIGVALYFLV